MREVEFNGFKYRTGRLTAFEQFHVARKLAPLLSGMGETFNQLPKTEGDTIPQGFWLAMTPVAEALSKMSTEDTEYVIATCLKTCTRQGSNGQWARVTAPNGEPMYEDIDMMTMLNLVYQAVDDNIGNFFSGVTPNGSATGVSPLPSIMPR